MNNQLRLFLILIILAAFTVSCTEQGFELASLESYSSAGVDGTDNSKEPTDPTVDPIDPGPSPNSPTINGEVSAGHDELFWHWDLPDGATYFEVSTDQGSVTETAQQSFQLEGASAGMHTIEVAACNKEKRCSDPSSYQTEVKYYGASNTTPWRGVAKADITKSPTGNVVAVSCHNCYSSSLSGTLSKVHNAIDRRADLVELDLVDAGGVICVVHDDISSCGGRATFSQSLSDSKLSQAAAMLFIEIKERKASPAAFAKKFLEILNQHKNYSKNGRLLFIRSFNEGIPYLKEIAAQAKDYPFIKNYLRYSVLYRANAVKPAETFQARIRSDIYENGFHFVEFQYGDSNLLKLVKYSQSIGIGAGTYTLPNSSAAVQWISDKKEELDQVTTDLPIDSARRAID